VSDKTVYYTRHGENKANITREFSYKKVDYSLTDRGIRQAEATARALEGRGICAIYCSPLKRAVETAEIVRRRLNLDVVVPIEEFREINVGSLEGREPTDADWKLYDQIMKDWRDGEHESRFPDGENCTELIRRATDGLLKVLGMSAACQNILIVGHGGILLAAVPEICENAKEYDLSGMENCSISVLRLHEEPKGGVGGRISSWRDCSHLLE
jgi:broad specificity phosphatase PhoE